MADSAANATIHNACASILFSTNEDALETTASLMISPLGAVLLEG
jgi:hypothetical protein